MAKHSSYMYGKSFYPLSRNGLGRLSSFMDENNKEQHKRQVRYIGRYPREFTEKYKELSPDQYGSDVEKVVSRGQTPAGTHIPICPVEILSVLDIKPGIKVLDATLGYGGHSGLMLEKMEGRGLLVGVDVDPFELPKTEARLRACGWNESVFKTRRMNFAAISSLAFEFGPFDAVLADLGVSSMQVVRSWATCRLIFELYRKWPALLSIYDYYKC